MPETLDVKCHVPFFYGGFETLGASLRKRKYEWKLVYVVFAITQGMGDSNGQRCPRSIG